MASRLISSRRRGVQEGLKLLSGGVADSDGAIWLWRGRRAEYGNQGISYSRRGVEPVNRRADGDYAQSDWLPCWSTDDEDASRLQTHGDKHAPVWQWSAEYVRGHVCGGFGFSPGPGVISSVSFSLVGSSLTRGPPTRKLHLACQRGSRKLYGKILFLSAVDCSRGDRPVWLMLKRFFFFFFFRSEFGWAPNLFRWWAIPMEEEASGGFCQSRRHCIIITTVFVHAATWMNNPTALAHGKHGAKN